MSCAENETVIEIAFSILSMRNMTRIVNILNIATYTSRFIVVVVLLFYVHGKHLRSCRDGQLT